MKFATIVFSNVLAALFSQKKITSEKRKDMARSWSSAIKGQDIKEIEMLLNTVLLLTENERFRSDIHQAINSLEKERN